MSNSQSPRHDALPFTAVSAVCRTRSGLDALAGEISAFIATDLRHRWTIELACERGHEQLLQRLVTLELAASASSSDPHFRSHTFGKALKHAVRRDNLVLLETLKAYCPTGFASWGMEEAAAAGRVHLLEWLETNCATIVWSRRIFEIAAGGGHVVALEWLKAYWIRLNDGRSSDKELRELCGAIESAAAAGHFETVQWLYENVNRFVKSDYHECMSIRGALKGGRFEIIKYLHDLGYRLNFWRLTEAIELVLSSGCDDLSVIEWLHAYNYGGATKRACTIAAERGLVDVVRWLLQNGHTVADRDEALEAAARGSHLEVVQILADHCTPNCYENALAAAAAGGDLDVVQWIFNNMQENSPEDRRDVAVHSGVVQATAHGHMEVAKWLHPRLMPQQHRHYIIVDIVQRGNLDGLKWLMSYPGARWHSRLDDYYAISNGDLDMLVWMREFFGYESGWAPDVLMDAAATHGHLHIVKWLHAQRKPVEPCTTKAMDGAAKNNHLHVVKWLHENRSEGCTTAAMDGAASLEMVAWLHEHRAEGCTTLAMDTAAKKGDFDTLLFLHQYSRQGCTVEAANSANFEEHVDVFRWLVATYPDVLTLEAVRQRIACQAQVNPEYTAPLLQEMQAAVTEP